MKRQLLSILKNAVAIPLFLGTFFAFMSCNGDNYRQDDKSDDKGQKTGQEGLTFDSDTYDLSVKALKALGCPKKEAGIRVREIMSGGINTTPEQIIKSYLRNR